ncbi:MAG: 4'-phosphopantetheinyl transferase superfamily protein [Bacteroidia bacterium]
MKKNEAHIWLYEDQGASLPYASMLLLNAEEKNRYDQYLSPAKQREFLLGKLLTRHVLSQYTGDLPENIQVEYNSENKPVLPGNPFYFNLSHSGNALAVIVAGSQTGVDVEYMRRNILRDHYTHIFTTSEIAELKSREGDARVERFFQLWTLKEAFWKALDFSSHLPFNDFSFTFDPLAVHAGSVGLPDTKWNFSVEIWRENFMLATATEISGEEPFTMKYFEPEWITGLQ